MSSDPKPAPLYTVAEFDDDPDAGMPTCRMCGAPLGVRRSVFSPTGRDEWWCDTDGRVVVWKEIVTNG